MSTKRKIEDYKDQKEYATEIKESYNFLIKLAEELF